MNNSLNIAFPFLAVLQNKQHLIFIVEDNNLYSFMLDYKLHLDPRYRVQSFSTGEDCIENLQMKPDVVILDYNLPGINGVEVLKRIKEFNPNIQVIILTQFDDKDIVLSAFNEGAHNYLLKEKDSANEVDKLINKIIDSMEIKKGKDVEYFWRKVILGIIGVVLLIIVLLQILK